MIYYLDASALVKVYTNEEGTDKMVSLLESFRLFYSSMVIYPEVLFSLRRKFENREMDQNSFTTQMSIFESHFDALINQVEFRDNILDLLKNRVIKYSARALDAIHLASAI
jgi:predicted nucleic acid-binding protein